MVVQMVVSSVEKLAVNSADEKVAPMVAHWAVRMAALTAVWWAALMAAHSVACWAACLAAWKAVWKVVYLAECSVAY